MPMLTVSCFDPSSLNEMLTSHNQKSYETNFGRNISHLLICCIFIARVLQKEITARVQYTIMLLKAINWNRLIVLILYKYIYTIKLKLKYGVVFEILPKIWSGDVHAKKNNPYFFLQNLRNVSSWRTRFSD